MSHFKTVLLILGCLAVANAGADQVAGSSSTPVTSLSTAPIALPAQPASPFPAAGQSATPATASPIVVPARTVTPVVAPLARPAVPPPPAPQNNYGQMLMGILSALTGGGKGGAAGAAKGTGMFGPSSVNGTSNGVSYGSATVPQYAMSGKMEACGTPPVDVKNAEAQAVAYRNGCSLAQKGPNQKIAINDYSTDPPFMFIFDPQGNCVGKTPISYGNGRGRVKPMPCNDDGSHLSAPGFFLTCFHNGAKFGPNDSLGLCGLEGQNTEGRGVVIHPGGAPGTASSWGCVGVGCFLTVKEALGEGALVYNYFGSTPAAPGCRNTNGLSSQHQCRLSPEARIPALATGAGTPAIR